MQMEPIQSKVVLRNVYIMPTSNVQNGVKTKSKAINKPTDGYEEFDKYLATKYFIHQWIMGKENHFLYNKIYVLIYNY